MRDIQDVITSVQKAHGVKSIFMGDKLPPVRVLPTGIPMFDLHLGGGLIMGRFNFIAGKEASGKTSIAMLAASNFRKQGFNILWIDLEKSFDNERCKLFGLNPEEVIVIKSSRDNPLLAEQLYFIVADFIRGVNQLEDNRLLIVMDSLAANVTEVMMEKEANKVFGGDAKINNQSIRSWNVLLDDNQCFLMINELRTKLDARMGDPNMMPGGEGQKYFASSITWTRGGEPIKEGEHQYGEVFKWTVKKSRTSSPKEIGSVRFLYEEGFDLAENLIDTAIDMEVIVQGGGGWFDLPNGERIRGKDKFIEKLKEDAEFMKKLWNDVYAKMPVPQYTYIPQEKDE